MAYKYEFSPAPPKYKFEFFYRQLQVPAAQLKAEQALAEVEYFKIAIELKALGIKVNQPSVAIYNEFIPPPFYHFKENGEVLRISFYRQDGGLYILHKLTYEVERIGKVAVSKDGEQYIKEDNRIKDFNPGSSSSESESSSSSSYESASDSEEEVLEE